MMKVSVIVPVYKVEKYIERCIQSLVNQTLRDIEIILVNDCTPDNSYEVCKEYAKKYKNIVLINKKKNTGLSDTRNEGIKVAKGEYIAFVDSDDYVDIDMYEKMYNKAIENDFDIVICDTKKVFEEGNNQIIVKSFNNLEYKIEEFLITPPMACNKLFRRELFDDEFKFKIGVLYEDLELIPSFLIKTNKIGYINEAFYDYLQRDGSIMYSKNFNIKLLDIFKVLDSLRNRFVKYELINKYQAEIEFLYISHLLRTATMRFLCYNNTNEYLLMINDTLNTEFPNWTNNKYYLDSSFKLKLICNLAYKRRYKLLKLIMNIAKYK